jgi:hypothetical protein
LRHVTPATVTRWVALSVLLALATVPCLAAEQVVTPSPSFTSAGGSTLVSADVNYESANPQNVNLTGLGLRIHFNSTRLNYISVGNVFTAGFVSVNPQADSGNFDGDAATDQFVLLSWADIAGHWPGSEPTRLLTITFSTVAAFTGPTYVRFSASSTAAGYTLSASPWRIGGGAGVVSDVNADGRSDLFWRNSSTSQASLWFMNGGTFTSVVLSPSVPAPWQPVILGDFDSDGNADVLWRNTSTGETSFWLDWNGTTFLTQVRGLTIPTAWLPLRACDFNRDGKADIFWRNSSTGQTSIWLMNGATIASSLATTTVASPWTPTAFGDFDNDASTDILWQNASTGETSIWRGWNGAIFTSQVRSTTVPTAWVPVGSGDINGDLKGDIFWRNASTGETSIWFMNGSTIASAIRSTTVAAPWVPSVFGDFDADQKSDLFWRNTATGETSIWRGWNGAAYATQTRSTTVPIGWAPVSP